MSSRSNELAGRIVMLLEPVYEQDFYDCSYGFRPRRSAHQALQKLWECLMQVGGGWVLEVDLRKYFDTLDHAVLRKILDQRVRDGVVRRLIGKWLKAGVWEEGQRHEVETGSPQGGVISPLLSNINLHEALDKWFETMVKKRMRAKLQALKSELRRRMHEPLAETGKWLERVVRGYFQYHAIPGNTASLGIFRERLTRLWWQTIRRRSRKHRINWAKLRRLFDRWLPRPCILHPFPHVRFDARYPR